MDTYVFTSNYMNCEKGRTFSISLDGGKRAGYTGYVFESLMPTEEIIDNFESNKGNMSVEENICHYINEYYNNVLIFLDPNEILAKLSNDAIILSYEDNEKYARHIIAFWLELFTDAKTAEISFNVKEGESLVQKRPTYMKKALEGIIKENYLMYGFNSIKAAYYYNKAMELYYKIDKLVKNDETYKHSKEYILNINYIDALKERANEEESEYNLKENLKRI